LQVGYSQLAKNLIKANTKTVNQKRFEKFKMNTKLATSRMRTGQWADIIKEELIKYPRENVLVSHRKSTMSLADKTYEMSNGRFS